MIAKEFTNYIFKNNIIRFGEFRLKSGRLSPYFFNFGAFNSASKLSSLGEFYASTIIEKKIDFDVIFGPAYKGIPIALSTALSLNKKDYPDVPFSFNRKEIKQYGEGGQIIGSKIKGKRVLAVDDVLTSGKTIRNTKEIIESEGGILYAFLVALDREEKGLNTELSALEEAARECNVKIYSVANISNIIEYLNENYDKNHKFNKSVREYIEIHGSKK
ncbi:orotate phosphoribosyltransferase [Rummeliibacillus sp. SL167]|uniref:orotate phosphoribosyltransferase n=1 Tax=Rummeliibacillus sp. SL167 TaxID=2579792 RepID=UPI0011B831E4|nr:orotate phosphoribosyltransferase [Rummeliibacillus sp. SL167]